MNHLKSELKKYPAHNLINAYICAPKYNIFRVNKLSGIA